MKQTVSTGSTLPPATSPNAFKTEAEARAYARQFTGSLSIIHSPHKDNKNGDHFVGPGDGGMIRYWEAVVYSGRGTKA
jgi:hypothetical protein